MALLARGSGDSSEDERSGPESTRRRQTVRDGSADERPDQRELPGPARRHARQPDHRRQRNLRPAATRDHGVERQANRLRPRSARRRACDSPRCAPRSWGPTASGRRRSAPPARAIAVRTTPRSRRSRGRGAHEQSGERAGEHSSAPWTSQWCSHRGSIGRPPRGLERSVVPLRASSDANPADQGLREHELVLGHRGRAGERHGRRQRQLGPPLGEADDVDREANRALRGPDVEDRPERGGVRPDGRDAQLAEGDEPRFAARGRSLGDRAKTRQEMRALGGSPPIGATIFSVRKTCESLRIWSPGW